MIKVISNDVFFIKKIKAVCDNIGIEPDIISPGEGFLNFSCEFSFKRPVIIIDGDSLQNINSFISGIKDTNPESFIIYVTSNPEVKFCKEIFEKGVNYFTTKPVNAVEIEELLKKNINIHNH